MYCLYARNARKNYATLEIKPWEKHFVSSPAQTRKINIVSGVTSFFCLEQNVLIFFFCHRFLPYKMSPSLSAKETTSINMVAGLPGLRSNTSYAYGVFADNFVNKMHENA